MRRASAQAKLWLPSVRQAFGCPKKMSAVAILDYTGLEALHAHIERLAEDGRIKFAMKQAGLLDEQGNPLHALQVSTLTLVPALF